MSDVVLVADGGEITVGRRVAGFAWGRWNTQVLDGEQPKTDDPRLVQGFVHKPTDMPMGRFDIRGVRADITQVMAVTPDGEVDYARGSSDAEQVLDAAENRSDGEVFFESDITAVGLGPHVPGVDFDVDSVVDVQLCQRRIPAPVTAVDMVTENGVLGWRVHAGGQPIVDSVRLNSSNTQILGVLAQERREAAAKVAEVSRVAQEAKRDARVADGKAEAADGRAGEAQRTADEGLEKWRQLKDSTDEAQSRQIKELEAQNAALRRTSQLQEPVSGSISSYEPLTVGPVTVRYPARNQIQFELTDSEGLTGASVLMTARVDALAQYSHSSTIRLTPQNPRAERSVGWAENYISASVLVIPTADFSHILAQERRRRDLDA